MESPTVDVFLSYARVDLEGLYAGEKWWPSIEKAIEAADAFVFLMSGASLASGPCRRELEWAESLHKRILPVAVEPVDPSGLPASLASVHWLGAFEGPAADRPGEALVEALDADPDWIRGHTRWLQLALEWSRKGRAEDRLLRGEALGEATA